MRLHATLLVAVVSTAICGVFKDNPALSTPFSAQIIMDLNTSVYEAPVMRLTGVGTMASNPQTYDFYTFMNMSDSPTSIGPMLNGAIVDSARKVMYNYAPFYDGGSWSMKCTTFPLEDDHAVKLAWSTQMGPLIDAIYMDTVPSNPPRDVFLASERSENKSVGFNLRAHMFKHFVAENCSDIRVRDRCDNSEGCDWCGSPDGARCFQVGHAPSHYACDAKSSNSTSPAYMIQFMPNGIWKAITSSTDSAHLQQHERIEVTSAKGQGPSAADLTPDPSWSCKRPGASLSESFPV